MSELPMSEPTKVLVLHIEVPGYWADDLDGVAEEHYRGDRLVVLTDDQGVDEQVGLTLLATGDESGPLLHSFDARIVGVETRDRRA